MTSDRPTSGGDPSPTPDEPELPGLDELLDEEWLRGALHGAADGIEPHPEALHRLRREVPHRRRLKRRVVLSATAAVVVCAVGVPLALHPSTARVVAGGIAPGSDPQNSSSRTRYSHHPAGQGAGGGASASNSGTIGAPGQHGTAQPPSGALGPGGQPTPGPVLPTAATGTAPSASPSSSGGPVLGMDMACGPSDLSGSGAASSSGGSFTFTNVSKHSCKLSGSGSMTATSGTSVSGGSGFDKLTVPTGGSFTVRFSYAAGSGCGASPSPAASGDSTDAGTSDGSASASSVTVTYAPAGGAPAANAGIDGVCGGSVAWSAPSR
ncbi:hypothetical protein BIV57_18270 [Mangrovactinospora gilvigrisea]|uniref:DUF4232 domain-containing protein n=1 Tax=Mangrovactinospora gilvigrisea TaxID=1428644 RepID=A0A1J7C3D8_9ACTN|nr:hypothetical protein [Mangrovactinospora gilvigrisea]OIV36056.1 hypothetical protein BIV57_18270 [Mangrovactinospora gilvigrisea]